MIGSVVPWCCPSGAALGSGGGSWVKAELGAGSCASHEAQGQILTPFLGLGTPPRHPHRHRGVRAQTAGGCRAWHWGRRLSVGTGAPLGDIWGPEPERCSPASRSPCRLPVKPRPRPWLPGIGSSWKVSGRVLPAREAPTCTRGRCCFQGVGCGNARGLSGEVE